MRKINPYMGFEYITVKIDNFPIEAQGLFKADLKIVEEILKNHPIRGKELNFIRKHSGLSLAKLSAKMNSIIDGSTLSKWEAKKEERLSIQNELLIRSYFSEMFDIKNHLKFTNLIGLSSLKLRHSLIESC